MTDYYLESSPRAIPRGLVAHLQEFGIDAALRRYQVFADGSGPLGPYPFWTAVGVAAGAAVAGPAGAVGLGVVGLAVDLVTGQRKGTAAPAPVPVLTVVEVRLLNVSPRRRRWAEYVLCLWARRHGWDVRSARGQLVDERNRKHAARRRGRAPRPWARRQR